MYNKPTRGPLTEPVETLFVFYWRKRTLFMGNNKDGLLRKTSLFEHRFESKGNSNSVNEISLFTNGNLLR